MKMHMKQRNEDESGKFYIFYYFYTMGSSLLDTTVGKMTLKSGFLLHKMHYRYVSQLEQWITNSF